jgi:hypothetical protein
LTAVATAGVQSGGISEAQIDLNFSERRHRRLRADFVCARELDSAALVQWGRTLMTPQISARRDARGLSDGRQCPSKRLTSTIGRNESSHLFHAKRYLGASRKLRRESTSGSKPSVGKMLVSAYTTLAVSPEPGMQRHELGTR